ncbi:prolyl oligopeptidase family serine peptidase [Paenibacillus sp. FSL K6-1096]|uniref:alpha/beta hydrolase family protein n=1 Tax=Paenibacillus sp. FSL K6-1096 TaxID=2921460 RepID=UPI0030EDBE0E
MRTFEIVVIAVILAVTAGIIGMKPQRRLDAGMLLILLTALGLHGGLEHVRIQMAPAYAAALGLLMLLGFRLLRQNRRSRPRKSKRLWTSLLLAAVLLLSGISVYASRLLPVFTLPEPTGHYAIGTVARELTDENHDETKGPGGKRKLMINVWYPADPAQTLGKPKEHYPSALGEAISLVFGLPKQLFSHVTGIPTHVTGNVELSAEEASYPVLLFSPGIRSTRFQSMSVIEELVSNGYVVVGIDHPYTSAKVTYTDGDSAYYEPDPEFGTSAELYNHNVKGIAIRAADASFVMDTLEAWNAQDPDGLFQGRLDLSRAGIFGHSYGGATTAEALAQDPRFKAGVSLEGAFWGKVAKTGLKQPFMYMMSGDIAQKLAQTGPQTDPLLFEEFTPDLKSVMARSTADTYFLTVDHYIHQSFTDIALLSPSLFANGLDPVHAVDISRSYVRAFFDQYLKDEPQALLAGPAAAYPEVTFDPAYTHKRQ